MNDILFSAFAFIITISFLVFIHEYGHFWVARRFGVKIEKFSIGFGKPIIQWTGKRDNTQYSISWIPLGGYVKMYGESSQQTEANDVSMDMSSDASNMETSGSFSALHPFKRLLIAFAGPAVNMIFAAVALWVLFIFGIPALKPTIGTINSQSSLAHSSIQSGDTITHINGYSVDSMSDATLALVDALGNDNVSLTTLTTNGTAHSAALDLSQYQAGSEMEVEKLAGFTWAITEEAKHQPVVIAYVGKGSPAQQAGIQPKDTIVSANGQSLSNWKSFVTIVQNNPNTPLTLEVMRNNSALALTLTPSEHPKTPNSGYAGVSPLVDTSIFEQYRTTKRYGVWDALNNSISANYLQGTLMLKTLWRLVRGKASVENLGGPLSIADYSGKSLSAGYVSYFYFLASISLILAVMNLLPVPVLDGGHILMCIIEMIRRKPLSEKTLALWMRLGAAVLMTFMFFVITLDVWRYLFK